MKITRAQNIDIDQISKIERESFTQPWSKAAFIGLQEQEHIIFLVAKEEEKVLGYGVVYHTLEEGDLVNIAVDKTYRKQGIGERLLEQVFCCAQSLLLQHLFLEVRKSNYTAIRLYEKVGFQKVGIRKDFYQQPKEDAYTMEKKFYINIEETKSS